MSQQRKQVFLDISLWSHKWFDDLPIEYQMAYLILWAESDNVGVWKPHFRELNFKLKQEISPQEFLDTVNTHSKRIEILSNNDWWLIEYLPLQVRTLTPNNRPHVSYIEDLINHGLLTRYAVENPASVKFDVIYELEDYEEIKDFEDKKKAKRAFKYLQSKGFVRPLKEACETLASGWQGSKEKEEEKDPEKDEDKDQVQSPTLSYDKDPKKKNNGKPTSTNGFDVNDFEIFGKPSLPNKAPF